MSDVSPVPGVQPSPPPPEDGEGPGHREATRRERVPPGEGHDDRAILSVAARRALVEKEGTGALEPEQAASLARQLVQDAARDPHAARASHTWAVARTARLME